MQLIHYYYFYSIRDGLGDLQAFLQLNIKVLITVVSEYIVCWFKILLSAKHVDR